MRGRFSHRALFHLGDSGRHRDHDPRAGAHPAVVHLGDEMPQHRLSHFEVGNDAVFQRPNGHNIGRSASEHALCFVADGEHFHGAGLHRHDRRLAQDDALILDVNERVGGAKIDPDVAGEPTEKSI